MTKHTRLGNSLSARSKKTAGKLLLLFLCLSLVNMTGCIVAAVAAAAVYVATTLEYTATVEVNAKPPDVYGAVLKILKRRPDIEIVQQQDDKMFIEIKKGENTAKAEVAASSNGMTTLKVVARENATQASHKDLALQIATQVCDELKVTYKVIDPFGMQKK